jgi:hypothetical protein
VGRMRRLCFIGVWFINGVVRGLTITASYDLLILSNELGRIWKEVVTT